MIPFGAVFIAAVIIYLWHQRNRENEALAEYPGILINLADRRDRITSSNTAGDELRDMAWAVFQASGDPKVWRSWSSEDRSQFRLRLLSASSPFLIEEAGLMPGSPRYHFTYSAIQRRLNRLSA